MDNIIFEEIKNIAKNLFEKSNGSHDWEHVQRVYNLCLHISKTENIDLEILSISCILHDIGRAEQDKLKGKIDHAELGANMAKDILKKYNFSIDKINKIKHCIISHRYKNDHKPESIEAKVLFDADKLDSIGAIGIGRAFVFAGENGAKVHNDKETIKNIQDTKEYSQEDTAYREYALKLIKIKDLLFTKEGKRIAQERHDFMIEFFDRLNKEVSGEI